jgi:ribosomal subunit interface protein
MQMELVIRNADLFRILRHYAARRLHFALSRFGDRVARAMVTVSEADTKRNTGRSCQISVDLKPFGRVAAQETGPDVYAAIDRAAGRIRRLLALRLERSKEMPRPTSPPDIEKPARGTERVDRRTPSFRSSRSRSGYVRRPSRRQAHTQPLF